MGRQGRGRIIAVLMLGVLAVSACGMTTQPEPAPERRTMPRAEQPDRVLGEYIVTLKAGAKGGDLNVRNLYSEFGMVRVTPIGDRRYLLKLERDPGFPAIKQKAEHAPVIESVQPNFIYRTQ